MFNKEELLFLRENRKSKFYIRYSVFTSPVEIITATYQSKVTFCNKEYLDVKFVKRLLAYDMIEEKEQISDSEVIFTINNKNLNSQLDANNLNKFVVSKREQKLIDYINLFFPSNERVDIYVNTLDKNADSEFITDTIITRLDRDIIDSLIDKGILYKTLAKGYFNKLELHNKFKKSF